MKKKKRRNKSIILRIMILGVCAYMVFTFAGLWKTWNDSTKQLNELKAMLEDGSKTKIIEKAARERLGYVYPDEQIFIDISGN